MRIEKLHFNKAHSNAYGLDSINLERLGSVVALVGRNGSGKTRALNLLSERYSTSITPLSILDNSLTHLPDNLSFYLDYLNGLPELKEFIFQQYKIQSLRTELSHQPNNKELTNQLEISTVIYNKLYANTLIRQQLVNFQNQQLDFQNELISSTAKHIRKISDFEFSQLQKVINTQASQNKYGPNQPISFEALLGSSSMDDDYNELSSLSTSALTYLSKLPHQLVHDKSESLEDTAKDFSESLSFKRYISLKRYVKDFLNKDLEYHKESGKSSFSDAGITVTRKGSWTLNKRPFSYDELSVGEKVLFAYSLLFFLLEQNGKIRMRESIIIIDEPEINLHPKSQIQLIRGIRNVIKDKGQLWIATHSINILSELNADEIFMVKDNSIIPPSRTTPIKAFNELMGLDDHIERLNYFISDISTWSYVNFITECFNDPDTISNAKSDDPEINALKKSIKEIPEGSILLDFGAGLGRVYKAIMADKLFGDTIKYHALEPEQSNREELQKLSIDNLHANYESLPENTFDYILMCGVLHEIEIGLWVETLTRIKKSLKENGHLIIIEDTKLPKGEKVKQAGFMIFDIESTQELFAMTEKPAQIFVDKGNYRDRILCMSINKKDMGNVTYHSLKKSLAIRKNNALNTIRELRKPLATDENRLTLGRESAFNSQLYINTILAEEIIDGLIKKPPVQK